MTDFLAFFYSKAEICLKVPCREGLDSFSSKQQQQKGQKRLQAKGRYGQVSMNRDGRNRIVSKPAARKQTPGGNPRERFRGGGHTVASYFGRKQASFPPLYPTDNGLLTCWTSRENRLVKEQKGHSNQLILSLHGTI